MKKILIIEKESVIRKYFTDILKDEGYDIIGSISSSNDAFPIINKNRPDLVLTDIYINGHMNGLDIAWICKLFYEIPVIFITAISDSHIFDEAYSLEPEYIIHKPIDEYQLKEKISNIFKSNNLYLKQLVQES